MGLSNTAMSRENFDCNIELERKFHKMLKAILGNYFIVQDHTLDIKEGTDFTVFMINPFRVGIRLRRFKYWHKFKNEFTIRYCLPSGIDTEYHKIMAGSVDYILYGFLNQQETKIIQYFIGDLNIFRVYEPEPIDIIPNKPIHDSDFAAYSLMSLPKEFILKKWQMKQLLH